MSVNVRLILETILVFLGLSMLALWLQGLNSPWFYLAYPPVLLFQGLWFYRFYIVGHEASHRKLFPNKAWLNDALGGIILLPLMVPINIYRKIHYFHHGFNRRDHHTSALDTFVIRGGFRGLKTLYYYIIWYLSVFFGGFFLHSLVSVILFLFMPIQLSVKISPAFQGWTYRDQAKAIVLFALGVGFHYLVYFLGGWAVYLYTLGLPMLSFAWVLSLLVYIFHYDTTKGEQVRYNVRSVRPVPFISWILMNFNEHATHHQYPNIPWHELPSKRQDLPADYAQQNQNTWNFFQAIVNQLKGPVLVYEDGDTQGAA